MIILFLPGREEVASEFSDNGVRKQLDLEIKGKIAIFAKSLRLWQN